MAAGSKPQRITEDEMAHVLEIGARAIYGWKKTSQNSWEKAAAETRASYRARMRELLNVVQIAGYEVRR